MFAICSFLKFIVSLFSYYIMLLRAFLFFYWVDVFFAMISKVVRLLNYIIVSHMMSKPLCTFTKIRDFGAWFFWRSKNDFGSQKCWIFCHEPYDKASVFLFTPICMINFTFLIDNFCAVRCGMLDAMGLFHPTPTLAQVRMVW